MKLFIFIAFYFELNLKKEFLMMMIKKRKIFFDTLFKLQIKTFFVVVQSEKEDTEEFQRFKENLLNSMKNFIFLLIKILNILNLKILFSKIFRKIYHFLSKFRLFS